MNFALELKSSAMTLGWAMLIILASVCLPVHAGTNSAAGGFGSLTSRLDQVHDIVTREFLDSNKRLDEFLTNSQTEDDPKKCYMRLSLKTYYQDGFGIGPNAKIRLALPRTEDRFHLFVEHFSDDEGPASEQEAAASQVRNNTTYAGLRTFIGSAERVRKFVDLGVDLPRFNPFIRFDVASDVKWRGIIFKPEAQVSWEKDDGYGTKLVLDAKYRYAPQSWVRTYSEVSWTQHDDENGLKVVQNISAPYQRTAVDAVIPVFEVDGHTTINGVLEDYWTTVRYRRLIYKDWLFVEIEPGFEFPYDKGFNFSPIIRFKIEVVFGSGFSSKDQLLAD